jgi:hypothetical protein
MHMANAFIAPLTAAMMSAHDDTSEKHAVSHAASPAHAVGDTLAKSSPEHSFAMSTSGLLHRVSEGNAAPPSANAPP